MEMLTTKRQLLAITAVIAAVVMATGTGVAELVAQPHTAAHQIRITRGSRPPPRSSRRPSRTVSPRDPPHLGSPCGNRVGDGGLRRPRHRAAADPIRSRRATSPSRDGAVGQRPRPSPPPGRPMRLLEHHTFRAMGTTCAVGVTTTLAELPAAHRAIGAAVGEVSACERALSRFAAESDLSRLNAAGGAWTNVDQRLLDALRAAVEARDATGGSLDRRSSRRSSPRATKARSRSSRRAPRRSPSAAARERPSRSTMSAAALGSSRARRSTSAASSRGSPPTGPSPPWSRPGRRCRGASSTSAATSSCPASRPTAARGGSPSPIRDLTAAG